MARSGSAPNSNVRCPTASNSGALERLGRSGSDDEQFPVPRHVDGAAEHRRGDESAAALAVFGGELARAVDAHGGARHMHARVRQLVDQAVAEKDRVLRRAVGDAGYQHVDVADVVRRLSQRGASLDHRPGFVGCAVVNGEAMAALGDIERHRRAHNAQSDKTYMHEENP